MSMLQGYVGGFPALPDFFLTDKHVLLFFGTIVTLTTLRA